MRREWFGALGHFAKRFVRWFRNKRGEEEIPHVRRTCNSTYGQRRFANGQNVPHPRITKPWRSSPDHIKTFRRDWRRPIQVAHKELIFEKADGITTLVDSDVVSASFQRGHYVFK